jgi:hypothetical protein
MELDLEAQIFLIVVLQQLAIELAALVEELRRHHHKLTFRKLTESLAGTESILTGAIGPDGGLGLSI